MSTDPYMNLHGWSNLLQSIAGKHGVQVDFVTDTNKVEIKGDRVTVPVPDSRWTQKDFDNVLYAVDSYGSMWRYGSDAFLDFAELPADKPIGWMMREFESLRTMREAGEEFRGSKEIMSNGVGNRMEDTVIPAVDKMDSKFKAVIQAGAEASTHWNRGFASNAQNLMSKVMEDSEAAGCVSKLDKIDFHEKVDKLEHPADSLHLAKQVFKALWDEDPDEQEKQERAEGTGTGGAAPNEMKGENPHGASDMTGGMKFSKGTDGNYEAVPEKDSGAHVETTPPCGRKPQFEDPTLLDHVDLKLRPDARQNRGKIASWADGKLDTGVNSAMFANKLRRLIMVHSQSYYTSGHKSGKISTRNLYKLCMEEEMPNEDRMFKRKHDSDILDTSVSILVDYSGSMSGSRTYLTHIGTDLLVHALNVLNVPCEVNMFTTIGEGTTVYTVKHFDEHVTKDKLLDRSERAADHQANNNDSAAVLFAYHRLKQRNEKRKILLVLSDGHPATHNVSNAQEGLLYVTQNISKDPTVELLGLGIESKAVNRYYPQHVCVDNAHDMPTALIDLIANKMLADEHRS